MQVDIHIFSKIFTFSKIFPSQYILYIFYLFLNQILVYLHIVIWCHVSGDLWQVFHTLYPVNIYLLPYLLPFVISLYSNLLYTWSVIFWKTSNNLAGLLNWDLTIINQFCLVWHYQRQDLFPVSLLRHLVTSPPIELNFGRSWWPPGKYLRPPYHYWTIW